MILSPRALIRFAGHLLLGDVGDPPLDFGVPHDLLESVVFGGHRLVVDE